MFLQLVSTQEVLVAKFFVTDITENSGRVGRFLPSPSELVTAAGASSAVRATLLCSLKVNETNIINQP